MIVVLDTNIFVYKTHMLGNDVGQQLLKLLEVRKGRIFLPEVLSKEYLKCGVGSLFWRAPTSPHQY